MKKTLILLDGSNFYNKVKKGTDFKIQQINLLKILSFEGNSIIIALDKKKLSNVGYEI